jgi:hypothetical protein
MRRLVLFVEGDGEVDAVPTLVNRLLSEGGVWPDILLDEDPFQVGSVDKLVKADFHDWKRYLKASLKRSETTHRTFRRPDSPSPSAPATAGAIDAFGRCDYTPARPGPA